MSERDWQRDMEMCRQYYSRPEDWLVADMYNSEGEIIFKKMFLPNAKFVIEAHKALSYWLQRYKELHDRWIADTEERIRLRYTNLCLKERVQELEKRQQRLENVLRKLRKAEIYVHGGGSRR